MLKRIVGGALILSGISLLLVSVLLATTTSASTTPIDTAANAIPFHGTPDPNATPEITSDDHTSDVPTYYHDIEPILEANCLGCHIEGGIGYSLFPMDSVETITDPDNADYIAFVVAIDYMPPWQPGDLSQPMLHERKLTFSEIAAITAWADAGAPLGDPADRAHNDHYDDGSAADVPTVRNDLSLQIPEPYTPTGELLDDYRCFVLDPELEEDVYVTGQVFLPDNTEIAHHALFFLVDGSMRDEALSRSGQDGQPGYPCFGGVGLGARNNDPTVDVRGVDIEDLLAALRAQDVNIVDLLAAIDYQPGGENGPINWYQVIDTLVLMGVDIQQLSEDLSINQIEVTTSAVMGGSDQLFGVWTPGAPPLVQPDNAGVFMPADSFIVVQMHYNLYGGVGSDQSTLVLQTEPYSDDIIPIRGRAFVAPVEIPCPADVDSPDCDRDTVMAQQQNQRVANSLLSICGQTVETYADNTAELSYGYCDYPIPTELWLIEVGGHMHELGAATRVTINPGREDEVIAIDIPEWDFHWQGQYQLAQPIALEPGDVIRLECWWSNEDGERYVVWGEGTQDEMCWNYLSYIERTDDLDLATLGYE